MLLRLKHIGLIVNPYAGIGGRVGLKGSDGVETRRRALEMGAVPRSPARTVEALRELKGLEGFQLITYPGKMGEDEAREAGVDHVVIGTTSGETSGDDTKRAASEMKEMGVDLIVFSGGDGTARDIYSVIGEGVPVLGVPTGVKIHSGVFALDPKSAGVLLRRFIEGDALLANIIVSYPYHSRAFPEPDGIILCIKGCPEQVPGCNAGRMVAGYCCR